MLTEALALISSLALPTRSSTLSLSMALEVEVRRHGVFPKTLLSFGPRHGFPENPGFTTSASIPMGTMRIGRPLGPLPLSMSTILVTNCWKDSGILPSSQNREQ